MQCQLSIPHGKEARFNGSSRLTNVSFCPGIQQTCSRARWFAWHRSPCRHRLSFLTKPAYGPINWCCSHGIASQFANIGWGGVDLFFVLSGFLITGILYDAKGAPHYFSNFWMRRVLRISPLYYGVLIAIFFIGPLICSYSSLVRQHLNEQIWAWAYGLNFYYALPSHVLINVFWLQHFWSLAIEEQFYLIWPFVIFFLKPKTAMCISAFCIGLALLLRVILVVDHYDPIVVWNLTPCRMDGLALGCLCALAARNFKLGSLLRSYYVPGGNSSTAA